MREKLVCCIIVILSLLIAGCNISDYKYTEPSGNAVKQICDEKTKICYPVEQNEPVAENRDDFDEEFEKLKQIVKDMNEEENKSNENQIKEETEIKEANQEETELKEEDSQTESKVEEKEESSLEAEIEPTTGQIKKMSVFEEETVRLKVKSTDPDGDNITYTFSEPLDENGVWETEIGDRGKYTLYVTVSDGSYKQTQRIQLEVKKYNRAPVLKEIEDIEVYEGDSIFIEAKATDEDKDPLKIEYEGWMNGPNKKTDYNDAGEYKVTVTVTDDDDESDSQVVNILVKNKNRAPIIEEITLG